jgi:hypothetical protein
MRAAAEQATAWCIYLDAHARRLYALLTDAARVAAAGGEQPNRGSVSFVGYALVPHALRRAQVARSAA